MELRNVTATEEDSEHENVTLPLVRKIDGKKIIKKKYENVDRRIETVVEEREKGGLNNINAHVHGQ